MATVTMPAMTVAMPPPKSRTMPMMLVWGNRSVTAAIRSAWYTPISPNRSREGAKSYDSGNHDHDAK